MESGPLATHVTLSFWVLVVATGLACVLAIPVAMLFARFRPRRIVTRWCSYLAAAVALVVSSQLPFVLVDLFLAATGEASGRVVFCFGDPHANMLFGVLVPPAAAVATVMVLRNRSGVGTEAQGAAPLPPSA